MMMKTIPIHEPIKALKIENLSGTALWLLQFYIYISCIGAVIFSLSFSFLSYFWSGIFDNDNAIDTETTVPNSNETEAEKIQALNAAATAVTIEGTIRTLAAIVATFILISFPQRTYLHSRKLGLPWAGEQIALTVFCIILFVSPGFSLYGVVFYWISLTSTLLSSSESVDVKILDLLTVLDNEELNYINIVVTALVAAFIFAFWGTLIWSMGKINIRIIDRDTLHSTPSSTISFGDESTVANNNNNISNTITNLSSTTTNNNTTNNNNNRPFRLQNNNSNNSDMIDYETDIVEAQDKARLVDFIDENDEAVSNNSQAGFSSNKHGDFFRYRTCEQCSVQFILCIGSCCMYMVSLRDRLYVKTKGFPLSFLFLVITYVVMFLTFGILFNYQPSQIPFVGIITIIRVCAHEFLQQNNGTTMASYTTQKSSQGQVTYNIDLLAPNLVEVTNTCAPQNHYPFARTISTIVLFIVEALLVSAITNISVRTKRRLSLVPYHSSRAKQLGFVFFLNNTAIIWFFIVLCGICSTAIPPIDYWSIREITVINTTSNTTVTSNNNNVVNPKIIPGSTQIFNITITIDPLCVIGVTPFTLGFSSFFFLLTVWLFILALAYLPADSFGFTGWFRSNPEDDPDKGEAVRLLYIATEELFQAFAQEVEKARHGPKWLRNSQFVRLALKRQVTSSLMGGNSSSTAAAANNKLESKTSQPPIHTLDDPAIMENRDQTLLLGHDAVQDSYRDELQQQQQQSIAENKPTTKSSTNNTTTNNNNNNVTFMTNNNNNDVESQQKQSSTITTPLDNQGLRLQLGSRVFVLETEILLYNMMHVTYNMSGKNPTTRKPLTWEEKAAFIQDDRFSLIEHVHSEETDTHAFVVASLDRIIVMFRGTVSMLNLKTDLDSTELHYELADSISPVLLHSHTARARQKAMEPPCVHAGFYKAWESVKGRICLYVENLRRQNPERVVFITGHSLGGGLAVICAFDFAVRLGMHRNEIGLTTWGTPCVGNFSFAQRFARVVPASTRFVNAGDLITKLPMPPPFQSFFFNGWWPCGNEIVLNSVGNMIIQPSEIESRVIHGTRRWGSLESHLRLGYGVSLMIWGLRNHQEEGVMFDWWLVVAQKLFEQHQKRLRHIHPELKQRVMDSISRSGITYKSGQAVVRDFACETIAPSLWGTQAAITAATSSSSTTSTTTQQPTTITIISPLVVAGTTATVASPTTTTPSTEDDKITHLRLERLRLVEKLRQALYRPANNPQDQEDEFDEAAIEFVKLILSYQTQHEFPSTSTPVGINRKHRVLEDSLMAKTLIHAKDEEQIQLLADYQMMQQQNNNITSRLPDEGEDWN
jgi:hypothetical protein